MSYRPHDNMQHSLRFSDDSSFSHRDNNGIAGARSTFERTGFFANDRSWQGGQKRRVIEERYRLFAESLIDDLNHGKESE